MKSKEAIVNEHLQVCGFYTICIVPDDKIRIYDAMDEYAKQEAIAFLIFARNYYDEHVFVDCEEDDEQLYNLFLESKKQKV